jgi:tRNA(Ile)-lysidine synthase
VHRVAVAYSGGRDSSALLHATLAAAAPLGISVLALHVHHGLSANADAWLAHCLDRCQRWARAGKPVELVVERIGERPRPGDSVEAWARKVRYRALRRMALAHGVDLVLLGHHRRDQAETFLLQALRGGGVAALSAMPKRVRRDGVAWARPWLETPREAIEAYARQHRLRWLDDESNDDVRLARNRLRRQVWPSLLAAFPDAEVTLASAARWAQQAAAAMEAMAASDLTSIAAAADFDLAAWRALPEVRQGPALRRWLALALGAPAPAALVERLLAQALPTGARRWAVPGGELHSYRGRLAYAAGSAAASPDAEPVTIDLSRPGLHEVALWHGAFRVEAVARGGVATRTAARLVVRARRPGDRFQAGAARPPRSLKLQFQSAGIAEAARAGLVVCSAERIVFVPGLGVDARAVAAADESQVALTWLPRRSGRATAAG